MANLKECLIPVELASAIRRVVTETGSKIPKGRPTFRCPECRKPVRPHVSSGGKLEAHFEHVKKNLKCPWGG
jgi:competence CoiA-like predicted nuclease